MCHFHSVIVDGAGRIYHLPSNSHSAIAAHFKLENNENPADNVPFWECEWDGVGAQPATLCQVRYSLKDEPTAVAESVAQAHYAKLAAIVRGEILASETFPFNTDDYSDVQANLDWARKQAELAEERRLAKLEHDRLAKVAETIGQTMFSQFGKQLETMDSDYMAIAIRALIDELTISVPDVAREEIEEIERDRDDNYVHTDSVYDYVLGDGDYISRDEVEDYARDHCDMFTQSDLDEKIDEAKAEWKKELLEALESAVSEAVENVG